MGNMKHYEEGNSGRRRNEGKNIHTLSAGHQKIPSLKNMEERTRKRRKQEEVKKKSLGENERKIIRKDNSRREELQ